MTLERSSDTEGTMYLLLDILLVLLGASMIWYRERLARYMARVQQNQSRAWPWAYRGIIGRFYTSEKAWRNVFIPILAAASVFVGVLYLWKSAY
jgi:predicted membrane protein